jgi:hypothetical protein
MLLRVTMAMEFTRVETPAAMLAFTSKPDGSIEGIAVVCFDARYAAIQWVGATRLDRRHAPAAQWRQFGLMIATLAPGVDVPSELADWLREGRGVSVQCTAVHQISAAPMAVTAALDSLFGETNTEDL